MIICGIDVGNQGALAFVYFNKKGVIESFGVFDMPVYVTGGRGKTKKGNPKTHTVIDEDEVVSLLRGRKPDLVFIEKSQAMPGQGSVSMFSYGTGYGIIRGICSGLRLSYTLVHPATWKRAMMKDMDKGKDAAIVRAKQLFPDADIKKKDGRAEALLLAFYGKTLL